MELALPNLALRGTITPRRPQRIAVSTVTPRIARITVSTVTPRIARITVTTVTPRIARAAKRGAETLDRFLGAGAG
jgi:hypothetical protein